MIKPPCGLDCPRRSATCHSAECPEWVEYDAAVRAARKKKFNERANERIVDDVRYRHTKPYVKK